MKQLAEDFLILKRAIKQNEEVGTPFEVTMEEIAEALFCTTRNAKLILTKMVEQGWIQFTSGRGRGHKSTLAFLVNSEEVVVAESKRLVIEGHISDVLELVGQYKGGTNIKEIIIEWLNSYFGYDKENSEETVTESIRFPIFRTINTLDPIEAFYDFDAHLIRQVYNTLLQYDQESGRIEGQLAHYWEVKNNYMSYTFYLRKGVMFHHGRELDSRDVVFSFQRLKNSANPRSQNWLMEYVSEIKAIDTYIVEVNLTKPNTLFLEYLCFPPTSILPFDHDVPVGTGPFMVGKHTSDICVLKVFTAYFRERAHLDRIEIIQMPSDMQTWGKEISGFDKIFLNTGETNVYYSNPQWEQLEQIYEGSNVLTINVLNENRPQSQLAFRKLLNQLIDRKMMIQELGEPRLYPSNGFEYKKVAIPAVHEECQHESLSKSGYSGELLTIYTYERHAPDAEWIKNYLATYGIHIEVQIVSWNDILHAQILEKADFILFESVWGDGEVSKLEIFKYQCSFIRNHLNKGLLKTIDQHIDRLLSLPTKNEREAVFQEIEYRLKENFAILFLVHKKAGTSFHPSVKGVQFNERGAIDFTGLWFQQSL